MGLTKKYYNAYAHTQMPPGYKIEFEDEDSFWVPCRGRDAKTGEIKENGFVRISVTILPKDMADANKVGDARSEPNHSPFLPKPEGRLEFSLNPFKMLS